MNAPLDNAKIVRLIIYDDSFSAEFSSGRNGASKVGSLLVRALVERITSENICVKRCIDVISNYTDNVFPPKYFINS